ncbi:hypothetical protein, conserved [Babesia bigemina]|uniref:RAP domain-containing protein n=1 Tax=Babesia bigemina TaxID=5866 RepID=A0A061DD45_BABBI|nr:hypothetical protein, conserved [Babesia bigemina]CDR97089.1 hypothetical protein, conserved [Babesia bigemina]|eukprot:XP_012769275.1 hypothetical protein, conserved [Babesia bigemina]
MRALGRSLFQGRSKVLAAPNVKRLAKLSCLDLRKQIQDSARRHIRMRAVWTTYVQEVCKRVKNEAAEKDGESVDRFSPTDISLIFAAFAKSGKRDSSFISLLLEAMRDNVDKYDIRDFAVLYNGLAKVGMQADEMINGFNSNIESRITAKTSEKDLALLLNALLELRVRDANSIFVKASLAISSKIKYIANCHTLTLLLHSYSRLKGFATASDSPAPPPVEEVGPHRSAADDSTYQDDKAVGGSDTVSQGHDTANEPEKEQSPEATLITETTLSLLGRCADLMIQMRPTDIMYYYKSALNLIYSNSDGVTRQLYASMANMNKAHIRIREHVLEFEARELVSLLQALQNAQRLAGLESPLDGDGAVWVVNNEIRNQAPMLQEEITDELTYRTRVMSFAECLGFLKLMDPGDHRGVLVCRRLTYKVNKMNELNSWERYSKTDLWDLIHILGRRSDVATSTEAQELMVAITKNITGTLKLREVDAMCRLAARLGAKSNSLLKKVNSVTCRADCLQPTQAASLAYHLTGLGYIEHIQPILAACLQVDNAKDALHVLTALAILKVNRLAQISAELVDTMTRQIEVGKAELPTDELTTNKIALLRAAGIAELHGESTKYRLYPRLFSPVDHVALRNVRFTSNKLKVDIQLMTLEQCTEDIANSLAEFLAKFDEKTRLHRNYDAGDMIVPIVIELPGSTKVAVQVLMNDFYSGRRQMLRNDVFAQMRLMEDRGIRTVGCRADHYLQGDRTQFIANLLERCHNVANSETKTAKGELQEPQARFAKAHAVDISPQQPKLDSFSRFRRLVAG